MALERTLSIVKPDGVAANLIGEVYRRFESQGLKIVAARMLRLSQQQAEQFYEVHRERPFYQDLVRYMTSGPVVAQVLEGTTPSPAIGRSWAPPTQEGSRGDHPRGPGEEHRAERRSRLGRQPTPRRVRSPSSSAPPRSAHALTIPCTSQQHQPPKHRPTHG